MRAISVLPQPVGPISSTLLFSSSTSSALRSLAVEDALVMVVHGDGEDALARSCPMT